MKKHDYLIQNTSRKDTVPFPLGKVEETFSFWYLLNNSGREKPIIWLKPGLKRLLHSMTNTLRLRYPELLRRYSFWIAYYLRMVIRGVRSEEVAKKIELHLSRFQSFFAERYGHERISACVKRDVLAFQTFLHQEQGLSAATVNNHLAHLSGFTTWVTLQSSGMFPLGDPCKGISELGLPPLEPRTLSEEQARSLKNVCDRLPVLHQLRAGSGRSTLKE